MDNTRIEVGHFAPFWNTDYKNLPFVKQGVTEEEISDWESKGYYAENVKSFTGSMYNSQNPMPDWISVLDDKFGLYNQAYTIYRMDTCEIMPVHRDHFRTYCKLNNCRPEQVNRIILMLEDWKPGHYFEINGVGVVNWKAGDWFKWQGDIPHAASNIGEESRYTLQITGLPVSIGQLNDLFSCNVPDIEDVSNHPFMLYDIFPIVNPNDDPNNRFMIYMDNGYINKLDTIMHSLDAIDILNKDGLHIYLYEPICSYHVDAEVSVYPPYTKHNQGFYSEFQYGVDANDLRADELDSIYRYAVRNNLTNVTVHTGDYEVDKWYPFYADRLTLICDDLFLRSQKQIINLNNNFRPFFHKKFICLNWRYTKHRQLVSTYLAGEDGYLSWHHKADFDTLKQNTPFKLETWEFLYPDQYNRLKDKSKFVCDNGPFSIDIKSTQATDVDNPYAVDIWPSVDGYTPGATPALFNRISNNLANFYTDSFVDIINETRFGQPTANFSEKVFQAIQYQKPFIVVGPPKTLEYIRSLGFKTFSEFWDESYDDQYHHGERLAKIFTVIDDILSLSLDEARAMYEKMHPIIEHNLNRFNEFAR